mgnify:CR=1 FL=1
MKNKMAEETGKYLVPLKDIKTYVDRAVKELNLDPHLVNDMDSAMYAWRLHHNPKNPEIPKFPAF